MVILNYFVYLILRLLGLISQKLNRKQRSYWGFIVGDILRILSSHRESITLENIRKSFPEKSYSVHRNIMRDAYRNLGITLMELLALGKMDEKEVRDYIKYDNIELINELYEKGNGVILLSGHFGNWELLAYSAGLFSKIPVTVIVKNQKNKFANKHLDEYRRSGGNDTVPMKKAARKIVSCLRNGEAIALLADQSASKEKDIFVDFFGRPASTFATPAALSLKFDVPLIMGFAVRQEDFTYRVKLREIKKDDLTDSSEDIKELTQRHVKELENEIRGNPGLWSWQHRRWKYEPK